MQLLLLGLVAFFTFLVDSNAQKIKTGKCPAIPVKKNFNVKEYAGVWYEIEKNPTSFEFGSKCTNAVYGDEGGYLSVTNRGVDIKTGKGRSIHGKVTIPDKSVPAKLKVKFDAVPRIGDYWVLDTDYKQYSVVFSCVSVDEALKIEYLWILSRTPTLDENVKESIYKLLDKRKISRDNLSPTIQDC
ncbi:Apolipoprotein D [Araneus ventricosus]|uniref:Apolipoprotein D n=1 Tax=Araneus ventricosus TaxID=182803 RepID=A0A4Y2K8A6_ARAVE|nr:Apolipoprotein D [Araneus ventricosus]